MTSKYESQTVLHKNAMKAVKKKTRVLLSKVTAKSSQQQTIPSQNDLKTVTEQLVKLSKKNQQQKQQQQYSSEEEEDEGEDDDGKGKISVVAL